MKGIGMDGNGRRMRRAAFALTLAGLLAACGGRKERPATTPPLPVRTDLAEPVTGQAMPGLTPTARLARVVELLSANDEAAARVELDVLLREEPNRREARVLDESIRGDPRALVPANSFAYIVQPGETYITIARDFLGDSYKFYALARLNGIAVNALKAGDTLQIPGRYRDQQPAAAPTPRARGPRPRAPEAAAPPAAAPAARTDPAGAQRLRRAGLESMSAGRVDQAVARLEQAARLDPANRAINADLARARRIQSTVRRRN